LTAYAVALAADVDPGMLTRFLNGHRGLTTATLDRLMPVLGLHLGAPGRVQPRPRRGADDDVTANAGIAIPADPQLELDLG
jgi:hypothetical protein